MSRKFLTLFASCFFSTTLLASDYFDFEKMQNIRIEKRSELDRMIEEYNENGKPIGLAVACGSGEMPYKIENDFHSPVPAIENWIALDLYLTDNDPIRHGPHIRMDAGNTLHWQQVAAYLNENRVKVQSVALTIWLPSVSSPILHETILPLVKEGGTVVYPDCFRTKRPSDFIIDIGNFKLASRYYPGNSFDEGLSSFYHPVGKCYQDKEALIQETMHWIEKVPGCFGDMLRISSIEAEKKLEAKVFVDRISSIKLDCLKEGKWDYDKLEAEGKINFYAGFKFYDDFYSKTEKEFAQNYFAWFKESLNELGFASSSYKLYASKEHLIEGLEPYEYPKDGTYSFTGYAGYPSLVLIKR